MADIKDWSTNSNEAVRICLRTPPDSKQEHAQFQPAFTYPIYGDEETIFGYRGLRIKLDFAADTLKPALNVSWREKFTPVGETKADEVEEKLKEFLPTLSGEAATDSSDGDEHFTPPGELVHRYESKGRSFGIWTSPLTHPATKRILRHMQIFIPLFIEGGTLIELDDPEWTVERWRVFFIYAIDTKPSEPDATTYSFAGYSTAYRLFFYDHTHPDYYTLPAFTDDPAATPLTTSNPALASTLPSRQRISQFLILPPYQSAGHGSQLYSTMLSYFLPQQTIREITVEDPNESFDDLRDVNDLLRLRQNPQPTPTPINTPASPAPRFTDLKLNTSARLPPRSHPLPLSTFLPASALTRLRATTKLCPRQFSRLLEMQLLSGIPPRHRSVARISRRDRASDEGDRAYYFWRLVVKGRLYRHNKELLAQMEVEERVERLEETLAGVEREYERLLGLVEARERRVVEEAVKGGKGKGSNVEFGAGQQEGKVVNGTPKRGVKRRVVEDDDDDDDDGVEAQGKTNGDTMEQQASQAAAESANKRVKLDAT